MSQIKVYFDSLTYDTESNCYSGLIGPVYADIIPLDDGGWECELSSDLSDDCLYAQGITALESLEACF